MIITILLCAFVPDYNSNIYEPSNFDLRRLKIYIITNIGRLMQYNMVVGQLQFVTIIYFSRAPMT